MRIDEIAKAIEAGKIDQAAITRFSRKNPNGAIQLADILLRNDGTFQRASAAYLLGPHGTYDNWKKLIALLKDGDENIRKGAMIAMSMEGNSRYFLPLAKAFVKAVGRDQKHFVYSLLLAHNDPRLLSMWRCMPEDYNPRAGLKRAAENLRERYHYKFVGDEELLKASSEAEEPVLVNTLEGLGKIVEVGDMTYPNTYIVDVNGNFILGNPRSEHTNVAKGKNVLTAGEIVFDFLRSVPHVRYINNRSNGYLPGGESSRYLGNLDRLVGEVSEFTEVFPVDGFFNPEFLEQFDF